MSTGIVAEAEAALNLRGVAARSKHQAIEKSPKRAPLLLACVVIGLVLSGCGSETPNASAISDAFGKISKAFVTGSAAAQTGPSDTAVLLREGDAKRAAGDLAAARALYEKAATADPRSLAAATRWGEAELALGHDTAAANAYRAAQALAPDDPDIAFRLGELALMSRDTATAIAQFTRAIKSRPNEARVYDGLGVAYTWQGDNTRARQNFDRGLALDPDNPSLRNNYGLMQLASGDLRGALGTFTALVLSPHRTDRYRLNLALVYTAMGWTPEAKAAAGDLMDVAEMKAALAAYVSPPAPNKVAAVGDATPAVVPSPGAAETDLPALHLVAAPSTKPN